MQQPPPQSPAPPGPPPALFPPSALPPLGYAQPYGYPPPPKRSRRRWWIFGCGGCAAVVLVVVVVIVVVAINTFSNSPLRHFPTEAGASTAQDNFQMTNGQSSETIVIDDPHSLTDVETYYQNALHAGAWSVQAADPSQAASGDLWHFSRTGSSSQAGVITFVTAGAITRITVSYAY